MKKIACFVVMAMLCFIMGVCADEFSDDADMDYSYNEDYDETETVNEKTSDDYDDYESAYDDDYESEYSDSYGDETGYSGYIGDGIKVFVNNDIVDFDVQPMLINDRTMVPMRAMFEALGASVSWNDATQTAKGVLNGIEVEITIGESCIIKNGEKISLDSPAVIVSDRTLVPVRAVAESFDCAVNWYEKTQTVEILK